MRTANTNPKKMGRPLGAKNRPKEPAPIERLMVSRRDVTAMLGISHSTLVRLEERGLLRPIKLGGRKAFYSMENVREVASGNGGGE